MSRNDEAFVVPEAWHDELVRTAYLRRGYTESEARCAAEFAASAARHGIKTHNAIKALHLDKLFGSGSQGCHPGAEIEKIHCRFPGSEIWNANRKLGQATAIEAIDRCIELAEKYGIGQVSVDNAFHYLWGGGYVLRAAKRGYIAYTNCTAALAEVVPYRGKRPTLGTNPHSWAFPTQEAIGFPILIDWATSVASMGRVQQYLREGKKLPEGAAVDAEGRPTTDPAMVAALLPFGAHKGFGLSLINELFAGYIGGSKPTKRSLWDEGVVGEKHTTCFYFQVIHPEAIEGGNYAYGRRLEDNLKMVLEDIVSGNDETLLPGQIEARNVEISRQSGGLIFNRAEIDAFNELAQECEMAKWEISQLREPTESLKGV